MRAASEAGVLQSIVEVGHSLNVDAPEFHPQEMEIVDVAENQSSSARLNLETTNNTADIPIRKKDKKKNTNQNTSSDNKQSRSGKRKQDDSGAQSSSKSADKNKKSKTLPKFSSAIITGYAPTEVETGNVKEVIVYDVPASWDDVKLAQAFNAWGKPISIFKKRQRKFQTVRVKIVLSDYYYNLYQTGIWSLFLGDILVRWFPIEWSLKDRQERERFQVAIKDLPEDLTYDSLIDGNLDATEFFKSLGLKHFKLIQTVNKKRKLIGYVETWQQLNKRICTPTPWGDSALDWQRHYPPSTSFGHR